MRWPWETKSEARVRRIRERDEKELDARLLRIRTICNTHMRAAQITDQPFPHKDFVVVPDEDLLTIWDQCDKIKWGD